MDSQGYSGLWSGASCYVMSVVSVSHGLLGVSGIVKDMIGRPKMITASSHHSWWCMSIRTRGSPFMVSMARGPSRAME